MASSITAIGNGSGLGNVVVDDLSNGQREQINDEYGAILASHLGSLRTTLERRRLGAALDLNPRTTIRYALVEAQRRREARQGAGGQGGGAGGKRRANDGADAAGGGSGGGDNKRDDGTGAADGAAHDGADPARAQGLASTSYGSSPIGGVGDTGTGARVRRIRVTDRLYAEGLAKLRTSGSGANGQARTGPGHVASTGQLPNARRPFRVGPAPDSGNEEAYAAAAARRRAAATAAGAGAVAADAGATAAGLRRAPSFTAHVPGGADFAERRRRRVRELEQRLKSVQADHMSRFVDALSFDAHAAAGQGSGASAGGTEGHGGWADGGGGGGGTGLPLVAADGSSVVSLVLRYVAARIVLAYDPRKFGHYLLHPVAQDITTDCFWLVLVRCFQFRPLPPVPPRARLRRRF
jgi:hypothetical protein